MADDAPQTPEDKGKNDGSDASLFRLLALGLQLTVTVGVFTAAGWWAQQHWGWAWGMQGLGLVGIVVGLYFFVKEATR